MASPEQSFKLPKSFDWGVATAAYQIEGAAFSDGKGKSIWDVFCHLEPTRTSNANGDVACDHYHRLGQDLDLLAELGAKSYRFSVSWPRVIPNGGRNDPLNEAGLAFYDKLIDGLLARNITPWLTMYHWDLPQALEERYGGWLNVDEIQIDFENYGRVLFERYGDRVKNWITINEPAMVALRGYQIGDLAPGRSSINDQASVGDSATEPWIVGKALIMSHARTVALYNREFRATQKGQISIVLNGDYYEPWDPTNLADREAAQRRMDWNFGWFGDPVFLAKDYPGSMRAQLKDRLPEFSLGDFAILKESLHGGVADFYGMNYYTAQYARHREEPPSMEDYTGNVDELPTGHQGVEIGPLGGISWLRACPVQFRKLLSWLFNRYKLPIIITENGCPCADEDKMTKEESIEDVFRQEYILSHLRSISQAIDEDGVSISGWFGWSFMDNLEWSLGYGPRFGVVFVDYETLERTPKKSARMLKPLFERCISAE